NDNEIVNNKDNPETETEQGVLSYGRLLAFFVPLAITPFFISTIHSLVNAAMARLPYPDLSIAVFSVVKGLTNTVKSSTFMFMQINVSLVDDRQSFIAASKFIWSLTGLFFAILFILGYTPAGGWFLSNVIGLQDPEKIEFAYLALRITCFLPIVEALRNIHRGLLISHERTKIISAATAVRLIAITAFLGWAVYSQQMSGILVGALSWTAGIGIEGLMVVIGVFYFFSSPFEAAEKTPDYSPARLTFYDILSFFLPLAVMMLLNSTLNPIIQSGIARSPVDSTHALAAYGVAFGIMRIISSPIGYLHNCSLVYVKQGETQKWDKVRRFSLLTGIVTSLVMLIIGLSPLGFWLLNTVIGVSSSLAQTGRWVFLAFSFFPFIQALRESYWGLLMHERETKSIGTAKAFNALTVFLVLFSAIFFLPEWLLSSPAVLGAVAYTIGQIVETVLVRYYSIKNVELIFNSE
ncbi:MAG: hypothetical protein ACOCQ1_03020, partial [Halanaerobiaceae bacterium]